LKRQSYTRMRSESSKELQSKRDNRKMILIISLDKSCMNRGTTHNDYGADTLARAQWYQARITARESA